jgi:hypothetical protein
MKNATAILDFPTDTFTNDELYSLVRFITSKEHLAKNFINVDFNHLHGKPMGRSQELYLETPWG